ncbi:unnamed protein product [marine sediment metagenome]|uniref:DUF433 domain-containing protein n=1 Tax=marine sediment metagenome TaxID=412755 RepID=X0YJ50_9ZZZZ
MNLENVTIDPDIMHGRPVLKGTRFPVAQLIAELADGHSTSDIAEGCGLDIKTITDFLFELAFYFEGMKE